MNEKGKQGWENARLARTHTYFCLPFIIIIIQYTDKRPPLYHWRRQCHL